MTSAAPPEPSYSEQAARPAMLTLATLNLYHWAEPGIGWYRPDHQHDAASWAAKRAWLGSILAEIAPDLIAFQEVVSIEALRADCAAAGLPHFAVVAEPRIRAAEDGSQEAPVESGEAAGAAGAAPRVYARPVQAIAARWPMTAAALKADPAVSRTLGLSHERDFRRPPVRAELEIPWVGPLVAYGCHLKSAGVGVEDALMAGADQPPEAAGPRARWTLEALSRAHGAAMIQRVFEASQLFHAAAADIAADPARPVAVLGDLNDGPDSAALAALTPLAAFERDGGAEPAAQQSEADFAAALERFRLRDAYRLAPRDLADDRRPATYRAGARGEAIDFVLVSAALQPGAASSRAGSVAYRVHDRHFRSGSPALSSDHAAVSVRFRLSAP